MSFELVEAIFKEQSEALSIAQRCQDQLKELLKVYMQRHHNATHNAQPRGKSKRHQQDNTAAPVEQAAPIRLEQQTAITCEDSHSDEDLIQGLQEFDRTRQQGASQQPLHGHPTAPAQEDQCNALDQATQQHSKGTTQVMAEHPVLPVAALRAFHLCTAKHRDGSYRCLKLLPYTPTSGPYHISSPHKFGKDILVEFWLAGTQHFCISPIPNATTYQDAARQLGAAPHLSQHTALRLGQATASSTSRRCGAPANSGLIIGSNHDYTISSESARNALAQLTWEELVLAYNRAQSNPEAIKA